MADERKSTDPSAIVIPFGKHKGATVAELLARDPAYADWVTAQGWVAERFAELHSAILSRGAGTDDTPEHNALQARFLEESFCLALARMMVPADKIDAEKIDLKRDRIKQLEGSAKEAEWTLDVHTTGWAKNEPNAESQRLRCRQNIFRIAEELDVARRAEPQLVTAVRFEEKGVDVILLWGIDRARYELKIELKPTIGDDFPSVMRQMKRLGAWILIVEQYHGRGVAEPQFRKMMALGGMTVIFLQEIEEAIGASPIPHLAGPAC